MNTKHELKQGIALIQSALNRVANLTERGSVDACIDAAQELLTLIDDLPQAVMDGCHPDTCSRCHHYSRCVSPESYGERTVYNTIYECDAVHPNDCPAVRAAGLGPDLGIEVPAFLHKQAI